VTQAPKTFDVWFQAANTVYKGVPYHVVADWVQQSRLAASDLIRPSGSETWVTVQEYPLLADYLPQLSKTPTVAVRELADGSSPPTNLRADLGDSPTADELFEHSPPALYRRSEDDEEVDMVPLIDISMVLLVFFIMIRATGALAPVEVPEMRYAGQLTADPEAVTLVIDKLDEERVYYAVRHGKLAPHPHHDNLLTPEAALAALDNLLASLTRPPEVRVACHKDLPYERILELQPELEARRKKNMINSFVATVVEAPRQ
jgi:biopolymer transport protein ExbD